MIHQMARYQQPQPQFVRFKALGNESIPLTALLGGLTLAFGAHAAVEARPIGAAYEAQVHLGPPNFARQEDVSPVAALAGAREISVPVISMTITLAAGTSMPTSSTVVATRRSISPLLNCSMIA